MNMKPWIKIALGVIAGFAAGFGTGFFVHKKMNDVQFEEVTDEEMNKLESQLEEGKKTSQEVVDIFTRMGEELADEPEKLRIILQGKTPYDKAPNDIQEANKVAYEAVKNYSSKENADELPVENDILGDNVEEGLDEEFIEMLKAEEVEPGQMEPPHVISLGEFYNERPEYDKITIDWYEPDNVYLDEREEIIPDISSYVGVNAGNLFAKNDPGEDPDIRFVRNEQYGSDYEIIRHHRSYQEMMGGSE